MQGAAHGDWQLWAALEHCHCADAVRAWPGRLDALLAPHDSPPPPHVQRRLCLARAALAADVLAAGVVVLDRPAGRGDPGGRRLLEGRHVGAGRAVVYVGDTAGGALRMDWVAVLAGGRVLELGRPAQLRDRPESVFADMLREEEARADEERRLCACDGGDDSDGGSDDDVAATRPRHGLSSVQPGSLQLSSAPSAGAGEAAVAAAAVAAAAVGTPVAAAGEMLWKGLKNVVRASNRLRRSGTM